jgi:hypothetical protein
MDKNGGQQVLPALPESLCKPALPNFTSSHCKSKRQQHKLFHKKMNDTIYLTANFGENILKV